MENNHLTYFFISFIDINQTDQIWRLQTKNYTVLI